MGRAEAPLMTVKIRCNRSGIIEFNPIWRQHYGGFDLLFMNEQFGWMLSVSTRMIQEEKASQVLKMRDIYAKARQVIVWLGEEHGTDRKGA
jgi:hypothetical protein